jgi:hypothetical protein
VEVEASEIVAAQERGEKARSECQAFITSLSIYHIIQKTLNIIP